MINGSHDGANDGSGSHNFNAGNINSAAAARFKQHSQIGGRGPEAMGTATSAGGMPTAGASSQPLRSGVGGGAGSGLGGGMHGTGLAGGYGTANTYCPSSLCIEVGETKFYQIIKNVFTNLSLSSGPPAKKATETTAKQDQERGDPDLELVSDSSDYSEASQEHQRILRDLEQSSKQDPQGNPSPMNNAGIAKDKAHAELLFAQLLFNEFLDAQGMESVGFRGFCCLVLLVSASDSKQLLQFLFHHGALAFDVLAGGQQLVNRDRLLLLGRILGIDEATLQAACPQAAESPFGGGGPATSETLQLFPFDAFQLLYFQVFQAHDTSIKS